jgi:antitoxin component HigA of HigAB toxin-antitoxin module
MPTASYEQLLLEALPARIEDDEQYREVGDRLGDLIGKGRRRTQEESKLMHLLALLVEDYDRRHALPPEGSTPAEMVRFLMEHSGKTAADLVPVFGQRSHVNEALNGKRPISAEQARKLGKLFGVTAGVFV